MKDLGIVLIIGKVWPEPNSSAAGTRMMQLIDLFIKGDYRIVFGCTANKTEFQEDLDAARIENVQLELNNPSFNVFVKELNPDIVVFDRFMTEEQFGWRVMESCPNALRVLNTEDLHFLRETRRRALSKGEMNTLDFNNDDCYREIASIYRSHITLLVSTFEENLLKEQFDIPEEMLFYLPVFGEKIKGEVPTFENRKDFLFVGNFYHKPNWDAVRFLRTDIWPLIHKELPEAKLHIYGAYTSHKVQNLHSDKFNFLVHGRAEDIIGLTANTRVSLAPLRFGAGIKGKLLEAMACGTPNVTTPIGAEGMCFDSLWGGGVEQDFRKFAKKAVELYVKKDVWSSAQEDGFELLEKYFSSDQFEKNFLAEMNTRLGSAESQKSSDFLVSFLRHQAMLSTKFMSQWIVEKNKSIDEF